MYFFVWASETPLYLIGNLSISFIRYLKISIYYAIFNNFHSVPEHIYPKSCALHVIKLFEASCFPICAVGEILKLKKIAQLYCKYLLRIGCTMVAFLQKLLTRFVAVFKQFVFAKGGVYVMHNLEVFLTYILLQFFI